MLHILPSFVAECETIKAYASELQVRNIIPAYSCPSSLCRSGVDDISLGLEHIYRDFNVVYIGLIAAEVRSSKVVVHFLDHHSALIDQRLPQLDRPNKPCPPTGRSIRHY